MPQAAGGGVDPFTKPRRQREPSVHCKTSGPPLGSQNWKTFGRNTMKSVLRATLLAALFGCCLIGAAAAQEPPAMQGASAQEKARLAPLIEGAKKEGSLTYWDVVIQPKTNDALTAAFRNRHGLHISFQAKYQLSRTSGL